MELCSTYPFESGCLYLILRYVWVWFFFEFISFGVYTALWICKFIYITNFGTFSTIIFSDLFFSSTFHQSFSPLLLNPNDVSVGSFGIIPQLPETPLSYLFSVCSSDQIISCAQIKFTNSLLSPILSLCPSSEVFYSDIWSFSSKVSTWGNSLVVQWLGLCAFAAKDKGSLPG